MIASAGSGRRALRVDQRERSTVRRLLLALCASCAMAPALGADVSVNVSQPGFYGRLDIGGYPEPQVLYPQPVIIRRVPPGHAKNWGKHCARYDACNRPVYFVREDWYRDVYAPRFREHHGDRGPRGDRDDRGRRGDDEDRGRDHGRGRGHRD